MKEQIEKAVQKFGGWTAFETQIKGKSSRNFKRTVLTLLGKLNSWLKIIGLQITIKNIDKNDS
ncbi:MAG: hypothetical protein E6Q39_01785 [Crocinitomicaceae bacterium]|jgi:hypothetical protein|nr:MAG: hypothetical protein E6Q39_01785 [Crocinitomicaceae bacterium]